MLKSSWPTRGVLVSPICEELCMETHPLLRGSTSTTPRAHLYSPAVFREVNAPPASCYEVAAPAPGLNIKRAHRRLCRFFEEVTPLLRVVDRVAAPALAIFKEVTPLHRSGVSWQRRQACSRRPRCRAHDVGPSRRRPRGWCHPTTLLSRDVNWSI